MKIDKRLFIVLIMALAFIPGACALSANLGGGTALSGSGSGHGNVASNGIQTTGLAAAKGTSMSINADHWVQDIAGKRVEVDLIVPSADSINYHFSLSPGTNNQYDHKTLSTSQASLKAQEWLDVTNAKKSIQADAKAVNGAGDQANVGIKMGSGPLTGYTNSATATDTQVTAQQGQSTTSGSGNSITITGSAKDGSGTYSISTPLSGSFTGLSASSLAGTTTQVSQVEQIVGSFSSTASAPGKGNTKTRTSNFGTKYDVNMQAAKGSSPTGVLGYYVDPSMSTSSLGAIQGAVNAAQSGDTINAAAGTYQEAVNINKGLTLKGSGNPTANSFSLTNNAILGTGSGGITAPLVTVNSGSKIQDGVTLASSDGNGKVNVGPGSYTENVVLGKSLTVNGAGQSKTTVNGNQAGSVFTINPSMTATLSGMTITNGKADGGGIYNMGTLTLNNVAITGNKVGGGIYNEYGVVNMGDGSSITGNTATDDSGGIYNEYGVVNMGDGSSITDNTATNDGGGIYNYDGTVTMNGGSITDNKASDGGGIYNYGSGTVTMNAGSSITGNTATNDGGGIYNDYGGTVTMNTGSITDNTAFNGGGIYNNLYGTVTMNAGSSIAANTATDDGGGIYNAGNHLYGLYGTTVTMNGGSITDNKASDGGGIYNIGTVNMGDGSSIAYNTAHEGGGIYNNLYGMVNMNAGSSITSNEAAEYIDGIYSYGFGGGIYNIGTVNMNGVFSSIAYNTAYQGGGIYNNLYGTVNMNAGSTIAANKALFGGGIYSLGGAVTMNAGSSITGNEAAEYIDGIYSYGYGGGIYNAGNYLYSVYGTTVTMNAGSTIAANTANVGGGIYNDYGGTVTMYAGSSITDNKAVGYTDEYGTPFPGTSGGIANGGILNNDGGTITDNSPPP